nr:MAG: NP1 [Parvovirinae sp.]
MLSSKREGSRERAQNSGSPATSGSTSRNKVKTTPAHVFSEHRARTGTELGFCGFYWHSNRLARLGTNLVFDKARRDFQQAAVDGRIGWTDFREILFQFKKLLDQSYRNMMYHFSLGGNCDKCTYWDEVYKKHLAGIDNDDSDAMQCSPPTGGDEVSDQEMLDLADATS